MNDSFLPDDIISVITRLISPYLKHLRRYVGVVRAVQADGVIKIHSIDYGTYAEDPESWVVALPGVWIKQKVVPEVGDEVEFYFLDGSSDTPRWSAINGINGELDVGKAVIYEEGQFKIEHLINDDKVEFTYGQTTMTIALTSWKVKCGPVTFEITPTGITTSGGIVRLNGKVWDNHIHPTTGLPPQPTGPPV